MVGPPPVFVADASFALAWAFSDEETPATRAAWEDLRADKTTVFVPTLWIWEVLNSLLGEWSNKRITKPQILEFLNLLRHAEIQVITPGIESSFDELPEQMWRHGLTSYDAAYLCLAMKLKIPLATFDKNIRKAAVAEGVELVEC